MGRAGGLRDISEVLPREPLLGSAAPSARVRLGEGARRYPCHRQCYYISDIEVPEVTVPTIEAAIKVPAAQVEQLVVQETHELAE